LLAGDALLINAIESINNAEINDKLKLLLLREFCQETGHRGLIAGQMVDIESEGKNIDEKTLNYIHKNKTGRLINLAIRFGCILGKASEADTENMRIFGEKIGLAFQIIDDILDIEGDQETLGKSTGKDTQQKKATYPSINGLEESRTEAEKLIEDARARLERYGEKAIYLDHLAEFLLTRKY